MRLLLLVSLVVVAAFAHRDEMLETNRIPSHAVDAFNDACGECKGMVKRFVEAIDDPQKMAELKMLLGALCHETSYAEECKMFVSKLDFFIKKLEPYLRDEEAVCRKMHLCGNAKLTTFHRIGMLYVKAGLNKMDGAKDFVCDECQLAAIELKKVVDDKDERAAVKQFISENICKHIPKYQGACDLMLEEFLPELWDELDAILANPKQACQQMGFCPHSPSMTRTNNKVSPKQSLQSFWEKSKYMNTPHGTMLIGCFECKVAVDTLVYALREPTAQQSIADGLRNAVCPRLPAHIIAGCEDFLSMYAPTVVAMTVEQINPEGLCDMFKACTKSSMLVAKQLTEAETESMKCEACQAFSAFMEYEMTQPDFKSDVVAGVRDHFCNHLRDFSNLCENLAESYIPKAVDRLVKKFDKTGNFCTKTVHAC